MRFDFCHTIHDDKLGIDTIHDIECEVEVDVEMDDGSPIVTVTGVYVDGADLCAGNAISKAIASEIAAAAESSSWLFDEVMRAEGLVYRGLGGNDPEGRFVRVA